MLLSSPRQSVCISQQFLFSLLYFHMQMKSPQFSAARTVESCHHQENQVLVSRKELRFRNSCASQSKDKNVVDSSSSLQDERTYHTWLFTAENNTRSGQPENSQGLERGVMTSHWTSNSKVTLTSINLCDLGWNAWPFHALSYSVSFLRLFSLPGPASLISLPSLKFL